MTENKIGEMFWQMRKVFLKGELKTKIERRKRFGFKKGG
jgi:hypothetical protein